jgi:nicotinamidase/pyrazinamidase
MSTVYVDVDTQIDFLFPAGALYVPGGETLIGVVSRLNRHAVDNGIPLISTADAHTENDPEFKIYPPHCVAGTVGQGRPQALRAESSLHYTVEKQTLNCFDLPAMDELLRRLKPSQCVVYGVVTEICVRYAALGLLKRGYGVTLVTDAVLPLNRRAAGEFLAAFQTAGGRLTTSGELASLLSA